MCCWSTMYINTEKYTYNSRAWIHPSNQHPENSLVVQWLGLHTFSAKTWVQSLVGELSLQAMTCGPSFSSATHTKKPSTQSKKWSIAAFQGPPSQAPFNNPPTLLYTSFVFLYFYRKIYICILCPVLNFKESTQFSDVWMNLSLALYWVWTSLLIQACFQIHRSGL